MTSVCLVLSFSAACSARPLGIDELIDPDGTLQAALSPDTRHVAAVVHNNQTVGVILIDTATGRVDTVLTALPYKDGGKSYLKAPRRAAWAGNEMLIVDYGDGVLSVKLNGSPLAWLGQSLIGVAGDNGDSAKVIVRQGGGAGQIASCEARTGHCTDLGQPPGHAVKWAFDKSGQLRAVTTVSEGRADEPATVTNWYRAAADSSWEKLGDFEVGDEAWTPVYVPDEPGTIVIRSRAGRDTYALFNYDVATRRMTDMLAGHPTQDLVSWNGIEQQTFDYVLTEGMRLQQIWFDANWDRAQQQIDGLLPKTINFLTGDPGHAVLIRSYGDMDPGSWRFFDFTSHRMLLIGKVKPDVDAAKLRPVEIMSYPAADGLTIPAYLTRPAARPGPAPMVVLIHGGPIARDNWEFNAEVQLLASRGYLVFQPQFRGSTGFGRAFEAAGYRQWGRAMQDDITAGVGYLVQKGWADPQRICIVGASYGGYAALWGLVKTPQLYQCGVSFAGVSDMAFMFSDHSDSNDDKITRQLMQSRIGSTQDSARLFDPVSPLLHAADIQAPVLLMHGEEDRRVPIEHGKRMRDALVRLHKQVKWVAFPGEGHGLGQEDNKEEYFETLLSFLDKYIGPGRKVTAPSAGNGQ